MSIKRRIIQLLLLPIIMFVMTSFFIEVPTAEQINTVISLDSIIVAPPITDRGNLSSFMEVMALRESDNTLHVVNWLGYMGKYQFGPRTLWALGDEFKVTKYEFLRTESLQDRAMMQYMRDNRRNIADIIVIFDGKWYQGIYITESGLLAGAHLVGSHGLRAWLEGIPRVRIIDAKGTHVSDYVRMFSKYNLEGLGVGTSLGDTRLALAD